MARSVARHQIGKYLRTQQRLQSREHRGFPPAANQLEQDDPIIPDDEALTTRLSRNVLIA